MMNRQTITVTAKKRYPRSIKMRSLKIKTQEISNIDQYGFGGTVDIIVYSKTEPDLISVSIPELLQKYPSISKLGLATVTKS